MTLKSLVRMKLVSFCDKDRMQLRDMIDVELIDQTRLGRLSPELSSRLEELLRHPDD